MDTRTTVIQQEQEVIRMFPNQSTFTNEPWYEKPNLVKGSKKVYIRLRIKLHIFLLAWRSYGSFTKALKVVRELELLKKKVFGGTTRRKLVQYGNRYYSDIYIPGYPSKAFDDFVVHKLSQLVPMKKKTNALSFIFFAITSKCPLQCEHCFEWDNLNKKETFTREELKQVIDKYQEEGISQFHFSGGEPMVRIKDLEHIIITANHKSEFWVLTSGFNLTRENARSLAKAGTTGVVISLDHYDAQMHNAFRGFSKSFEWAMQAIQNAKAENLVVAVTICVTQSFATWENLMKYTEMVKSLGVHFIQVLEPKPVGHYKGRNVLLGQEQLQLLERFYHTINFGASYRDYPIIIYHGYHQRRLGCFSAGYGNLYIDAEGFVNACPFCQSKSFNVKELIKKGRMDEQYREMRCPDYGTVTGTNPKS